MRSPGEGFPDATPPGYNHATGRFERFGWEEAMTERQSLIDALHAYSDMIARFACWPNDPPEAGRRVAESVTRALPSSETVMWPDVRIWNMCQTGADDAFEGGVAEESLVNRPNTWWTFGDDLTLHGEMAGALGLSADWVLGSIFLLTEIPSLQPGAPPQKLRHPESGAPFVVPVYVLGLRADAFMKLPRDLVANNASWVLPRLRAFAPIVAGQPYMRSCIPVVAALRFLDTKVASRSAVVPPRGERRRREKAGLPDYPAFYEVLLREVDRPKDREPGHREVDWKCRWPVRAHWRRNWRKPGQSSFVNCHVRGPAGKPLKESSVPLKRVGR